MGVKYCVAAVNSRGGQHAVSFYAYQAGYGRHLVSDWDDPHVCWHDTVDEARGMIWGGNYNECVLPRWFEEDEKDNEEVKA